MASLATREKQDRIIALLSAIAGMPADGGEEVVGAALAQYQLDAIEVLQAIAALLGAPLTVRPAQSAPIATKVPLAAGVAATALAADADIQGARILNWTASPVYVAPGMNGTPASGAPSDVVPAAADGLPGQFEPPFAPITGLRVIGASAGDLTVERW